MENIESIVYIGGLDNSPNNSPSSSKVSRQIEDDNVEKDPRGH